MASSHSTTKVKPWLHKASCLWCVKRKGKRFYLGRTESEAVARYKQFAERIERGLKIPDINDDAVDEFDLLTVADVCDHFMIAQQKRVDSKDLSLRSFRDYLRSSTLPELQAEAREAKAGLWSHGKPVSPWEWRKEQRAGEKTEK